MTTLTAYIPVLVGREVIGSRTVVTSIFPALGYAETLVLDTTGEDIDGDRCDPTEGAAREQHARFVRHTRDHAEEAS